MARTRIDWEGQREIATGSAFILPAKEALRIRNAKIITAFMYVWTGSGTAGTLVIESAPDPSYPDGMWNPLATYSAVDLGTSGLVKAKNLNGASGVNDINEYLRWRTTAGTTGTIKISLMLMVYDI